MRQRRVVYTEASRRDLVVILRWIAEWSSPEAGLRAVERIEEFVNGLGAFSERGTQRSDIRQNLRMIPFRRAMIAAEVTNDTVYILHIYYGGQDWEAALSGEDD